MRSSLGMGDGMVKYQISSVLAAPSMNATESQGSIAYSSNSLTIAGWTSATIVLSRAKRKTQERIDMTGMKC